MARPLPARPPIGVRCSLRLRTRRLRVHRSLALAIAIASAVAVPASAQSPKPAAAAPLPAVPPLALTGAQADNVSRIIGAAITDDTAWQRLAYLSDRIGNRISGSAHLDAAI